MPQTLNINNFDAINLLEATLLDGDTAIGATSLLVQNNTGYAVNDFIVIGRIGDEGSEMRTIASTSTTTGLTTDPLVLKHNRYEMINKLFGSQVKIYRAPNTNGLLPPDTSFSFLASTPIEVDQQQTIYTDPIGSSAYWYKYTYYNPTSLLETNMFDSTAQRGGGYAHYVSIAQVRAEAGFKDNPNIANAVIDSMRIEAEQEVESELYNVYTLPFALPVPAQVQQAVRQIAAGQLLDREYGAMTNGSKTRAKDLLDRGRMVLESIKSRQVILLDGNKNSLLLQPQVVSWPNATTNQTGSGSTEEELSANNQDYGPRVTSSMRF